MTDKPITRRMSLFRFNTEGDVVFVDEKRFRYRSEFQERLVANKYCEELKYFDNEGFIAIADDRGKLLHKLPLLSSEEQPREMGSTR